MEASTVSIRACLLYTSIDTKNKDVSLDERVSITKKIRPDVFLSIHANSSTVSSATGTECYYFHLFSRNMADRIASNVSSSLGLSNRNNNGTKMYPYKVLRMSSAYPVSYTHLDVYKRQVWLSYIDLTTIMKNKSKAEFTAAVNRYFDNAAQYGFNDVIVKVRPFGDAIYP